MEFLIWPLQVCSTSSPPVVGSGPTLSSLLLCMRGTERLARLVGAQVSSLVCWLAVIWLAYLYVPVDALGRLGEFLTSPWFV